ncbi:SDR family NAD(P)-dependent oxidoreductase [Salipaludibacillus daqingensis]|uniref:SDR family NAD(P)-dependent oxidoreductase n=1 Tax=Salipaludibacillus daqingensis TaxID=3041001 RepID=UPI002477063A|nr:SDR family oxidoreductase [Salipaludibacillus daqingensis]
MTGKTISNERVAITGASSGIGKEMALEVAKRGGVPILLARSEDKLQLISQQIQYETGIYAPYYRLDITDVESIKLTFQQIYKEHGPITTLINNAGFAKFDSVLEASLDDAKAMFQVNVLGTIACTKEVLTYMKDNHYGQIIFVASQAAKLATPKASVYAATKHAVLGFANSLRMELHDDPIHVSVVNPGPIRTEFLTIADKTGEYEKSMEKFILEAEYVAKKIVQLIKKPKRELNLPIWMGIGSTLYQLCPRIVEKVAGKQLRQK